MKYIIPYILLFLAAIECTQGQTNTQNYILSRTFKQAGANENDVSQVNIQVQYMDGLGREIQKVSVRQSPAGTDIVQPVEYDIISRLSKQYLPYVAPGTYGTYHSSAATDASSWYTANSAGLQKLTATDLNRPYNENFYEQALNRSTGQRAPGERSGSSSIEYLANTASEVKRYDYTGGTISQNGNYGAGTLTRAKYNDEMGNETNEYTDKTGQLVCKQVVAAGYTYYIYDDSGLLHGVLQPNFQDDNSLINSAFIYDYDERNRLIKKQIPGGGTTEIVYDNFDRPALSRDANQTARGVWAFTKYDALNRQVATGEISSTDSRATWVNTVNAITEHHENRDDAVVEGYTLNKTAPVGATEATLLTITFYDTYSFQTPSSLGYTNVYYSGNNGNVKGQQTGGRTRMLMGDGSTGSWRTNVIYYDGEYRPIQTTRQLHDLGATAVERISTKYAYDLAAVVAEQKTEQAVSTGTNSHLAVYSYDHADRLLNVKETVAFGSKTKTAYTLAQRYNTLGVLQSKWFHGYAANASKYRRRTSYTNNMRGWLTDAKTSYQQVAGTDLPFYAFGLAYHNGSSNYTNGNIDSLRWRGKDESSFSAGLIFSYDGANRLTSSTGLTAGSVTYAEKESGITYDKNGNIQTLSRSGAAVDNLTYTYTATPGNRLKTVNDASGNNTGFRTGTLGDYGYDANGNMTYDINRQAILNYNYLNLPMKAVIGTKEYIYDYDAGGSKHKYGSVNDTVTVKYAGRFEYDGSNVLKRVITAEGQVQMAKVLPSPASDSLRFDYYLKDHLGNVRVVFNERGNIIQKSDYYPFGLSVSRDGALAESTRNNINRYLYNGKELQVGTGFVDYGARSYMPEIGRWGSVDPSSENSRRWSPFTYGADNPLRYIDPDGRDIVKIDGGVRFTGSDIAIAYNAVVEQIEETGGIMGIHFVKEENTPMIYTHTLDSFRKGKPNVLHYDSDQTRRDERREIALKGYPSRFKDGLERDEYPFASTIEGGAGANIAYVPSKENRSQGGSLGALYKTLKSGDAFLVFPVPRDKEPETNLVPVVSPRPLVTPKDVGVGIVIGIGLYETIKWATAIFLIPETGGGSIPAAAALP